MLLLVAIWAFAEAVLFFIVADVPIMALAARSGVRAGLKAAGVAAICAALGGACMWWWASSDPNGALSAMVALPGIDMELAQVVAASWNDQGLSGMMAGSFTGQPYKLYAWSAGAGHDALLPFALVTIVARLPRFALVALVSGWLGPRLRARLGERWFWTAFVAAWAAFYLAYFTAMGW